MAYRLLLLDIDGTLRPIQQRQVPLENVRAVQALQRHGIKVAIATGRGLACIPEVILNGIEPDYWLCAAGGQVVAGSEELYSSRLTPEEMEALISFCDREEGVSLGFTFSDGPYVYVRYEELHQWELKRAIGKNVRDGEDRTRHLTSGLPFSAYARIEPESVEKFQREHPELGLKFLFFAPDGCDILRVGQDKATGFHHLLQGTGIRPEEAVFVGDSYNDIQLMQIADLSFCVDGGAPEAMAAAKEICPSAEDCGVAWVCHRVWPEAFTD